MAGELLKLRSSQGEIFEVEPDVARMSTLVKNMADDSGTDEEILEFATSKYEVSFPMFSKIEVNGDGAAPLYEFLKEAQPNPDGSTEIQWNFTKFLVDGEGKVLARFGPKTTPEEIEPRIAEHLGQ